MSAVLPYGIVLLAENGEVLELNAAARALLGRVADNEARATLTCCRLFGCHRSGSPLRDSCLTDMALEVDAPAGELRVELPAGSNADSVWATVTPLPSSPARVLVSLRAADPADRPGRRKPPEPRELQVFTLGRTRLHRPEGPLPRSWLRHRCGMLLKYLICERRRTVNAEEIAEALWPGGDQHAVNNVRHFIHGLRTHLEPARPRRAPSRFVLAEPGGYRLNTEVMRIDADEFEAGVRTGLRRANQGDRDGATRLLTQAVSLYGGDFLADERYALWVFSEQERLRDLAREAFAAMVELRRIAGDLDGAAAYVERLADMYPLDPDIHREALALALERGRHTVAQRRYAAFRRRLLAEFGHEPSFDLADVAEDIETRKPRARGRLSVA